MTFSSRFEIKTDIAKVTGSAINRRYGQNPRCQLQTGIKCGQHASIRSQFQRPKNRTLPLTYEVDAISSITTLFQSLAKFSPCLTNQLKICNVENAVNVAETQNGHFNRTKIRTMPNIRILNGGRKSIFVSTPGRIIS